MIMPIRLCDCASIGRDAHGVAGVMLGLGQRAPVEQRQRQRLRRRQIVRIEPHDPGQQRLRRRRAAFRCAKLAEQRERADILRRALENLDELPLGLRFVAGGKRRPLAAEIGGRLRLGPRRRPVKPTAARIA